MRPSISRMVEYLEDYEGPAIKLMEVCGTHTASIFKSGIRSILPESIELVSGPGCPVCVTPKVFIDACIDVADMESYTLLSFGDMLKVPGEYGTLSDTLAMGGSVKIVYSPFEALTIAEENPNEIFVIAAVGFETTAPAFALLIDEMLNRGISNVKFLTALKNSISAIEWICRNESEIAGFIAPGHVSVITGEDVYKPLSEKYDKPFAIAGFDEDSIVKSIYSLVCAITEGLPHGAGSVINLYEEVVSREGNLKAQAKLTEYFEAADAGWRGLGNIPDSGFALREEYAFYDMSLCLPGIHTGALNDDTEDEEGCRCSDVLTGRINPGGCPLFGTACTPNNAIGPCMVSAEGACGIWYHNILK